MPYLVTYGPGFYRTGKRIHRTKNAAVGQARRLARTASHKTAIVVWACRNKVSKKTCKRALTVYGEL